MRIAVISDIHGNLPALEAVIKDLEAHSPDDVWCGGDLGWGGPWASECIALVREAGWKTVKGNTDVWITGDPQTIDSPDDRKELEEIAHAHDVSSDDALWLLNLPIGHSGPGSVLLVHGTPESPFNAPMPDDPPSEFLPYEGQAGLVIYAHVHVPFVRKLTDGTLVCNTGSVGMPKEDTRGSYLLLDHEGPEITLRHRSIEFDVDAAVAKAKDMGGPVGERFVETMTSL